MGHLPQGMDPAICTAGSLKKDPFSKNLLQCLLNCLLDSRRIILNLPTMPGAPVIAYEKGNPSFVLRHFNFRSMPILSAHSSSQMAIATLYSLSWEMEMWKHGSSIPLILTFGHPEASS